jgi:hypothetical protein
MSSPMVACLMIPCFRKAKHGAGVHVHARTQVVCVANEPGVAPLPPTQLVLPPNMFARTFTQLTAIARGTAIVTPAWVHCCVDAGEVSYVRHSLYGGHGWGGVQTWSANAAAAWRSWLG